MSYCASSIALAATEQMFEGLARVLDKAAAHAEAENIDERVLLEWRLAPNMFPMARQVQIAGDVAARGLARLANTELPSFPDTETSFADLKDRLQKTLAFVKTLDPETIDSDEDGVLQIPTPNGDIPFTRRDYFMKFVLPNFYFHVTSAYANLRACGVDIGKRDYLAAP